MARFRAIFAFWLVDLDGSDQVTGKEHAHDDDHDNRNDVKPKTGSNHFADANATGTENHGIRWCAHRHHKSTRSTERGSDQHGFRVYVERLRDCCDKWHHGCCKSRVGSKFGHEGRECRNARQENPVGQVD